MDLHSLAEGLAAAKTGFDTLRTAIGLVRDVQTVIPEGEKKQVVTQTLEEAERQMRIGEAQIAQALGYQLCRCQFPPIPMLKVGYGKANNPNPKASTTMVDVDIHECPVCKQNDARGWRFTRVLTPEGTS
jgi:hypothetical protein